MLRDHQHVAYFYGGKLSAPLYTVESGREMYLKKLSKSMYLNFYHLF